MVTGEFLPIMEDTGLCLITARTVFQLGGAPLHFCHVHTFLDSEIHDRWVRKWGPVPLFLYCLVLTSLNLKFEVCKGIISEE
jgi:hypothetical protein